MSASETERFLEVGKKEEGIYYATTPIIPHHYTTSGMMRKTSSELDLVRGILQMMQGLSSSLFYWDLVEHRFCVADVEVSVTHLSRTSLHNLLSQFTHAATCLQLVNARLNHQMESRLPPTLMAFASVASHWLQRLRDVALKEEMKMCKFDVGISPTLLGLSSSLSSLCSGAEYLLQIVNGAIPQLYFERNSSVPPAEIAVHVLDYLYLKLDQVCLVQGGEEEAYPMLLHMFVGSIVPYIQGLDSWLFEGAILDPFEEMFFYANKSVSVGDSEFWEKSYQLRELQPRTSDVEHPALNSSIPLVNNKMGMGEKDSIPLSNSTKGKEPNNKELQVCPLFIREIAKSIVSAGKSLQLIRHVPMSSLVGSGKSGHAKIDAFGGSGDDSDSTVCRQKFAGLTLSEVFCVSVAGLIGHGDHISRHFLQDELSKPESVSLLLSSIIKKEKSGDGKFLPTSTCTEKVWYKFLVNTLMQKKVIDLESQGEDGIDNSDMKEECMDAGAVDESLFDGSFCPENPLITVCRALLVRNRHSWKTLNISRNFCLPPLNDEALRKAIFGGDSGSFSAAKGTDYSFGFQFGISEYHNSESDTKLLESLFPFPTVLPSFKDDTCMSELLPCQKNSTLVSRILSWLQSAEPRTTPLSVAIMQECLIVYIKEQVDYTGKLILSKLMNEWGLMDELAVLRIIYLLGSGDLLQHFFIVIFGKLDKGETWDDDFELNTILQESVRNSADGMLLTAPDSLVVSINKNHVFDGDEIPHTPNLSATPRRSHLHSFGIDGLDSLKFTYKVSWPLELIVNTESIKKYNQVMGFLLKVKRAKFLLDKARRWMWKGGGNMTNTRKHHWLVEQKLLHFVDAFHQYVMDRVYHSAWRELCEGMAAAGTLDEVIEVHEAYLLSIQRQCFVVPDKLWALIASRINSILGLALDFYSIQQTLSNSGAASAMKARCEMEVDRIEKQFDDCITFLLRVLSLKLNVGNFPHLADLVTRINYNYFYMSDSGNLMATTSSDAVTSRLGKTFGVRAG